MNLVICKVSDFCYEDIFIMNCIDDVINPRTESAIGHYFAKKFIADKLPSKVKDIHFKYTEKGKPYFNNEHFFSISHTGEYVFVTYSNKPTGVDAELVRHINPRFIYKVLADGEINDNADFNIEFLKAWTLKEAYLKMNGEKMGDYQSVTKQNLSPNHTIITNVSNEFVMTAIYKD